MNPPIFCFVAHSGTGKTTYLTLLVAELKRRGLRVAVVKHDAHHFDIDHEGKDSHRFTDAGADVVALHSASGAAVMHHRPVELNDLLSSLREVDIILAEGYKTADFPKIIVHRLASGNSLPLPAEDCLAAVTDTPLPTTIPQFPLDDVRPMADFLLRHLPQAE